MNHTTFDVSRFQNASGSTAWRVTGWLHGQRVRKNFKSHEEASAEKASLEIKAFQATSGLRSIATPLTDEQVREAEAAFRRLANKPRPLTFYLDFAFANYREPESQKPLADAITDYVAAKKHEREQDQISVWLFGRFGRRGHRTDARHDELAIGDQNIRGASFLFGTVWKQARCLFPINGRIGNNMIACFRS